MEQLIPKPRLRLAPERGQRSLVPYLSATLVLMGALYLGLRAAPLMAERGWRPLATHSGNRLVEWRQANYDPKQDPILGMDIPSFRLRTETGRKLQVGGGGSKYTALLFVGDTAPCSVRSLMSSWSKLQKKNKDLRVVVVAARPDPKIIGGCTQSKGDVQVAIDGNGAAAQAFNAQWKPRAYLLDRAGRLAYVQPESTMDPIAPLEAEMAMLP